MNKGLIVLLSLSSFLTIIGIIAYVVDNKDFLKSIYPKDLAKFIGLILIILLILYKLIQIYGLTTILIIIIAIVLYIILHFFGKNTISILKELATIFKEIFNSIGNFFLGVITFILSFGIIFLVLYGIIKLIKFLRYF